MAPSRPPHSSVAARRGRVRPAGRLSEALETRTLLSAGDLDPTFAGDGMLSVADTSFDRYAADVVLQPDGKVLTVGTRLPGASTTFAEVTRDVALSRYNSDGTLDVTFGSGGRVLTDMGAAEGGAAAEVDGAGRIVVGANRWTGGLSRDWVVLRYLPDGRLDPTFGDGGVTVVDAGDGYTNGLADVKLTPDGKIVAAGSAGDGQLTVMRLTAGGRLDASFGAGGKASIAPGRERSTAYAIALDAGGKITASGYRFDVGGVVARFNADGSVDTTFDGDGWAALAIVGDDVALDAGGRAVIAGAGRDLNATVVRLTPSGQLDASFGGGDGVVTLPTPPGSSNFRSVAVAPGGDVVAAGNLYDSGPTSTDLLVASFTADGVADTSFNGTGWARADFDGDRDSAEAVAVAPGGKMVAAGDTWVNDFVTEALVRYNPDGSLDRSFDGDGKVVGPFEGARREVYDALVQPDRKVVVGGTSISGPRKDFYVARFNPDGTPDTSFEGNGRAVTYLGAGRQSVVRALTLQPDGKIVAAGTAAPAGQSEALDVAVARYNTDGTLDKSFAGDGTAVNDFQPDDDVFDVAQYPGGKIVVGGGPGLVRYNADGTLDRSFDRDGAVDLGEAHLPRLAVLVQGSKVLADRTYRVVRFNADGSPDPTFASPVLEPGPDEPADGAYAFVTHMAPAPDGDVVVLGFHHDHYDERDRYALWRLNPDGALDPAFGSGGTVVGDPGGLDYLNVIGLAVEADGRILVGANGVSYYGNGMPTTVVARHLPGGAPDHSFGIDGLEEVRAEDPDDNSGYRAEALALDPTGDVVVAGQMTWYSTSVGFGVARLNGDGAPGGVKFDRVHRTLTVRGTLGDDTIRLGASGGRILVTLNGRTYAFLRQSVDSVLVHGSDGDDTIVVTGELPHLELVGGAGNDSLRGGPGAEALQGGDGDDTLDGGFGADTMIGGNGVDSVDYRSRTRAVIVIGGDASSGGNGEKGENDSIVWNVEKVYGGSGDDVLHVLTSAPAAAFGGAGNDTLYGSSGPDALWGGDGDDVLVHSRGPDYLRGGAGNDTYNTYYDYAGGSRVSLDDVANDGDDGDDNVCSDVENLLGGPGDDLFTGSSANNHLDGGGGNDTLLGLAGDDTLLGGDGDDTLTDAQGINILDGGPGNDTVNGVTEAGGAGVASSQVSGGTAGPRRRRNNRGLLAADGAAAISESL
jgi:uncharacterized delta-60 repeat protein